MPTLDDLQVWYDAQCNGDWEHSYGVRIETLDNPGWHVRIDLAETLLFDQPFTPVRYGEPGGEDDPDRWMDCKVERFQFHGYGGPRQLEAILEVFLTWARSMPDWLSRPSEEVVQAREDWAFREHLGDEVGPETCQHTGCARKRIRHSVLCRAHHYEQVKGRPYPGDD